MFNRLNSNYYESKKEVVDDKFIVFNLVNLENAFLEISKNDDDYYCCLLYGPRDKHYYIADGLDGLDGLQLLMSTIPSLFGKYIQFESIKPQKLYREVTHSKFD